MVTLQPCPACGRHARLGPACPFCGADLPPAPPSALNLVSRRDFTRDAVVGAAAILAIGCRSEPKPVERAGGSGGGETTGSGGGAAGGGGDAAGGGASGSGAGDGDAVAGGGGGAPPPSDPCMPLRDDEIEGMSEEEVAELSGQRQWECEQQYGTRRGGGCTADGVCPPYGTPPIREIV